MNTEDSPLAIALSAAIPLRILEIQMRESSGPVEHEWQAAREFADVLSSKGDVLQYGGQRGEAASLFNRLAKHMAIMSFCPSGIHFAGMVFCAQHLPGMHQVQLTPPRFPERQLHACLPRPRP